MAPFVFDIAITLLAGFLDAAGVTYLSGLYVSFMSGNSTGLGIAMVQGRGSFAVASVVVICSFITGAFMGSLLVSRKKPKSAAGILIGEACLLLGSMVLSLHASPLVTLLPVCVAMGMQNALPRYVDGIEIGRSFVTGALFNVGKNLSLAVYDRKYLKEAAIHGTSWLALVVGAVCGSASLARFGLVSCLGLCVSGVFGTILLERYIRVTSSVSPLS
jgi:oxalate decarboxylase